MRRVTVQVDGPVNVVEYGGSGLPIVLVHGLGGSLVNWHAVGEPLTRYGRVVALDLVGFGWTPPEGRSSSIPANRDLVVRFVEEVVGEPAVLVGNSMGGFVSLLAAGERPDLVSGLVLVDPALPRPRMLPADPKVAAMFSVYLVPGLAERVMRWRYRRLRPEGVVRETLRLCTVDLSRIPDDVYRIHEEVARARAEMPWAQGAFLEAARSLLPLLTRSGKVRETIARIDAPALVVHGEEDRIVPVEAARQVAEQRPDWELSVLTGIGHVPQLEAPDRFVAVVGDWLERTFGVTGGAEAAGAG